MFASVLLLFNSNQRCVFDSLTNGCFTSRQMAVHLISHKLAKQVTRVWWSAVLPPTPLACKKRRCKHHPAHKGEQVMPVEWGLLWGRCGRGRTAANGDGFPKNGRGGIRTHEGA